MRKDAQRRLERLEQVYSAEGSVSAIVVHVVDRQGQRLPVLGYHGTMKDNPPQVMREPGESDADLLERATEQCRARLPGKGAVPFLMAVVPDDESDRQQGRQITLERGNDQ